MDMMMQTEKLPDFCNDPFYSTTNTSTPLQETRFSNGNPAASTTALPHIYNNPHESTPPLINPLFSMPFMGTPIQEPGTPSFQHDMMAKKNQIWSSILKCKLFLIFSRQEKLNYRNQKDDLPHSSNATNIYIDPKSIKPPKKGMPRYLRIHKV